VPGNLFKYGVVTSSFLFDVYSQFTVGSVIPSLTGSLRKYLKLKIRTQWLGWEGYINSFHLEHSQKFMIISQKCEKGNIFDKSNILKSYFPEFRSESF